MLSRGKDVNKINDVILKLARGETLPPKYKDHALSGDLEGLRDCHIENDWVLLYILHHKRRTRPHAHRHRNALRSVLSRKPPLSPAGTGVAQRAIILTLQWSDYNIQTFQVASDYIANNPYATLRA